MPDDGAQATVRTEPTEEDHVALVRIHRPDKRNALDGATRQALVEQLTRAGEDGARAVVLTGTGKSFASGADLEEMGARSVAEQRRSISPPRMYEAIEALPTPVIAAINGYALGAGLELALACDVRVASDQAKVGAPEVRLGIIPGGGGTQRLPRLVGLGQAMRLVLTGEIVEADEARELGIVDVLEPQDDLEDAAVALAGKMARWSPVALAAAKRALRASWNTNLAEGLGVEGQRFLEAFASEDASEGIQAFLEKRDPVFRGR